MLELARTVRFCVNGKSAPDPPQDNTYSAWPPPRGLARYYELGVRCRGEADPVTGYFLNIKHIDTAVREHALPIFDAVLAECPASDRVPLGALMRQLLDAVQPALDGSVHRLTLRLTPLVRYTIESDAMNQVLIRQSYEFSAAHRLHVPEKSDEENRAIFGKCNNPAGHGHNYRVEVAVACPIDDAGHTLAVEALDATVDAHAIDKLDHKHLNVDVPAFHDRNPSVEHIAQVVWDMLKDPIAALGQGVKLAEVSVWETGKTVCTYRGEAGRGGGVTG